MSSMSFDRVISREPSPTKAAPFLGAEPSAQGRIPMDPFSASTRSSGSASPVKQSPFQPLASQIRQNAPPSNAAIDLVIANAMANAPAPPHLGIMDQNARIGNEINRIRTPSAINNLFPAAVGIDGRVNLFVGNLPYRVRWQDLKDLFRRAGTVLRADVSLGQDNRSRGYGTVLMGSREDGAKAIDLFNGFNWQTRTLEVRPDRLPPEYEPQAGHNAPHGQQMPFQHQQHQGMHPMRQPMYTHFPNGPPFNGQFHPQQQSFFRPSPGPQLGSPMPGGSTSGQPFQHLPHQNGQSPMMTGAVPQPQNFGARRDSQQQLGLAQFQPVPRAGSFSSLAGPSDIRRELSPGPPEPTPMGRSNSLSPHVGAAAVGAIGEKPSSGPASSNGSSSGRAPPPVGLGPLPPNVFSKTPSLGSPGSLSVSPGTAGSNERPFGALGNGGMIRPQVGAPPMGFTTGRVLFIHNLPFQCQWQDLKDLLRPAGNIVRADVALGPDGRSRGFGTVLFASEADAQNAVRMFNGFEYGGRAINVYIDRNADRHNTAPNQVQPQSQRSQFQPYPQFPMQHFQGLNSSPFTQPAPVSTWQAPEPAEISPTRKEQGLPSVEGSAKSPKVPLTVDTSIASAKAIGEHKNGSTESQGRSSSGKHPHPGPIAMPSYPNFSNGNMNSPLMTRGLPPMTPSMPGFVFNAYPQTPPLHPHFMSPGFAPFSPGAPVTSPNMYQYNPFMNAAPGAPVVQNGGQAGAPPGRWTGYTAGLQTPQGNGSSNGDYFPTLPNLDTSVSTASSSAAASPLNAKQRFVSITPAVAPVGDGSPKGGDEVTALASAFNGVQVQSTDSSPNGKTRGASRSSIDFTKRGSLSAPWSEPQGERRASWDVKSKDVAE